MNFPAHIFDNKEQSCREHSENTARLAGEALCTIGLENAGYLSGLLHDCGKFTEEFAEYIRAAQLDTNLKSNVIHSFAGVSYLLKNHHDYSKDTAGSVAAEIMACAIAEHHGLIDVYDTKSKNGFEHRLNKQPSFDERAISNFLVECADEEKLDLLFDRASDEVNQVIMRISEMTAGLDESYFYVGLLTRLVTSAVINGDRLDTASFMSGIGISNEQKTDKAFWRKYSERISQKIETFSNDNPIKKARAELSDICYNFSDNPCGIYRLNLPTGAGKTLSSLRYALAHAEKHSKKRIIYSAPLISILEQNAKVIRNTLIDDIVLEHHSNVVEQVDDENEIHSRRLHEETWDSPVIVTTLVQLLNTFFEGRTSCVRRFQSLIDSVIIIDEVQTVPKKMITLFNLAINFLSEICNATVIMCSATQPCFAELKHPLHLSEKQFLTANQEQYFREIFRRNRIIDKGSMKLEEIPLFIKKISKSYKSLLVICNKKSEAEYLFEASRELCDQCFHLSASMCISHRLDVIDEISTALEKKLNIICVSTQVIEAGVDISFDAVIRLSAGMDSIIQSAGRCNRGGEGPNDSPVYIINCTDESLDRLKEIKDAKEKTTMLMNEHKRRPELYGDLSSEASINYYYKMLYKNLAENRCDFVCEDSVSIFSMLSINDKYTDEKLGEKYFLRQAFREAGKRFKVFDDDSITLLVPYGEGEEIFAKLQTYDAKYDVRLRNELINKAKRYSVSIFRYQLEALRKLNGVYPICDDALIVLMPDYYDKNTGLRISATTKEEDDECSILIL